MFRVERVMGDLRKYVILGCLFAKIVNCQEQYCISNKDVTAIDAMAICTLATPPFSSNDTGYEVNLNISSKEPLWIGYAEIALSYIGCLKGYELEKHKTFVNIANPSTCYFQCETPFIGIGSENINNNTKNCFCIPDIRQKYIRHCSDICDFPKGTLCGGPRAVSVYQKVKYPTSMRSSTSKHCLGYEPNTREFFWTACKDYLRSLCMNESGSLITSEKLVNWSQSMMGCFDDRILPVSYSKNLEKLPTDGGQYWIGTIRSFGVCDKPESPCNETDVRQGYIKSTSSSSEHFELQFGLDQAAAALCEAGNGNEACSPAQLSTPTPPTSSRGSTGSQTQTTIRDGRTTSSSSEEHDKRSAKNGGPSAIVAVYVAVPIALLLIAAVVGFILWRKRRQSLVDKPNSNEQECNDRKPDDEINGSSSYYEYENEGVIVTDTDTTRYDPLRFGPSNDNEYSTIDNTESEKPVYQNT